MAKRILLKDTDGNMRSIGSPGDLSRGDWRISSLTWSMSLCLNGRNLVSDYSLKTRRKTFININGIIFLGESNSRLGRTFLPTVLPFFIYLSPQTKTPRNNILISSKIIGRGFFVYICSFFYTLSLFYYLIPTIAFFIR